MDEGAKDWKETGSGNQTDVEIGFRGRIGSDVSEETMCDGRVDVLDTHNSALDL